MTTEDTGAEALQRWHSDAAVDGEKAKLRVCLLAYARVDVTLKGEEPILAPVVDALAA